MYMPLKKPEERRRVTTNQTKFSHLVLPCPAVCSVLFACCLLKTYCAQNLHLQYMQKSVIFCKETFYFFGGFMQNKVQKLVEGGAIAALYAILTLIMPFTLPGSVELRLSEALTLLPLLTPAAIPGLAVGCLVSNIMHGAVILDVILGTLATLLAALFTYKLREKIYIAALMPALSNGIIVGILLAFVYNAMPFYVALPAVFLGEAVICYGLGIPLVHALKKTPLFKNRSL